jgi:maltokinase
MIKTSDLLDHLARHLPAQRWFAEAAGVPLQVVAERDLSDSPALRWLLVRAGQSTYQLLLGFRPDADDLSFLHGSDGLIAEIDGVTVYDAVLDPELGLALLAVVTGGEQQASHVRPVGAEQSNTSLVFDDQLILKLFRRLHEGANPDIEVTAALARVGFASVAEPVAVWRDGGRDLAVVQPFLAGSTEGWALALTSLRDYYGSECELPEGCGGDFAGEARRLGEVTAAMHLALAQALGQDESSGPGWVDPLQAQLARVAGDEPWAAEAADLLDRAAQVEGGALIRVHGDLHLGQVVRADQGWFVLDFEGEPARPLAERTAPASPLKDVAGMIRSFQYAAQVALAERSEDERKELEAKADAWELHNREAYLRGYFSHQGVLALLPPTEEGRGLHLAAWELDKAVYELAYERAYRPGWEAIPLSAIERLVGKTAP